MTTKQIRKGLLIAALLASGAALAGDDPMRVSDEQGQPVAQFKVGDSHCVLKDDQVRCAPISKH